MKKLKILSDLFLRLSRLSKREKVVLYGAVFFISLTFLDRLILGPILSEIKSLNTEIQNQEAMIKKNLHILAQKERIKKDLSYYDSYVVYAASPEEETVFLLKDIEKRANKSSIYVVDIKSAGEDEEGEIKKYLVKLNCEAQMEQLSKFFYDVESSKKLLKIENYNIRPKSEGSSVLKCTVSISKALLPQE